LTSRICASIAPSNPKSVLRLANQAFDLGADYVEIRLDFLDIELLSSALQAVQNIKSRSVLTLRSVSEGGMFKGSEQTRLHWLYTLIEEEPMLVDIELATLQKNDDLADFLEERRTPVLVSWHDFNKTPSKDALSDIVSEMRIYSTYIKLVTTALTSEDSLAMLELYEAAVGLSPIFFAMGYPGVISRLLCTVIGNAPFTYASLESALAPGQLTIQQMKKLYDKMGETKN